MSVHYNQTKLPGFATAIISVIGIFLFDWSVVTMLFVYWLETGVVGLFNVVRMLKATQMQKDPKYDPTIVPITSGSRIGLTIFFCVHYGIFWLGHGFFIKGITIAFEQPLQASNWVWLILVPLLLQYAFEFARERQAGTSERVINNLFIRPYGRVVLQHLTIIILSIPLMLLSPFPRLAAVLLVFFRVSIEMVALRAMGNQNLWKKLSTRQVTTSELKQLSSVFDRVFLGIKIVFLIVGLFVVGFLCINFFLKV